MRFLFPSLEKRSGQPSCHSISDEIYNCKRFWCPIYLYFYGFKNILPNKMNMTNAHAQEDDSEVLTVVSHIPHLKSHIPSLDSCVLTLVSK